MITTAGATAVDDETPKNACIGMVFGMPPRRRIPDALTNGPFRLADAEMAGVSRSQLRGARYSRPFRAVHAVGRLTEVADRCVAALAVLPASAVFSDETAAALLQLPLPRVAVPLHVTLPTGLAGVRRVGMV